jgi:uncharacterized membrane protein YbhN (UPF0104 family)
LIIFFLSSGVLINIFISLPTFNGEEFVATFMTLSLGYSLLALVLSLLPWFAHCLRLMVWTRYLGNRMGFWEVFNIVMGTELGSAISPTAFGGCAVKIGMLTQRGIRPGASTSLANLASLEDGLFFLLAIPLACTLSASWGLPVFGMFLSKAASNPSSCLMRCTDFNPDLNRGRFHVSTGFPYAKKDFVSFGRITWKSLEA